MPASVQLFSNHRG